MGVAIGTLLLVFFIMGLFGLWYFEEMHSNNTNGQTNTDIKVNKWLYVVLGILGLMVWIYWYHFRGFPISDYTSDWGAFGNYVGCLGSLALSFSVLILTFQVEKATQSRHVDNHVASIKDNCIRIMVECYDLLNELRDMELMFNSMNIYERGTKEHEKSMEDYKQKLKSAENRCSVILILSKEIIEMPYDKCSPLESSEGLSKFLSDFSERISRLNTK